MKLAKKRKWTPPCALFVEIGYFKNRPALCAKLMNNFIGAVERYRFIETKPDGNGNYVAYVHPTVDLSGLT